MKNLAWCPSALPPETQIKSVDTFSMGQDIYHDPSRVDLKASTYMRNFYIDKKQGTLVKGNGYTVLGSSSVLSKVNFFYIYYHNDGSKEFIMSDSSIILTTKDFQTYTQLFSGLDGTSLLHATTYRGKAWIVNGTTWDMVYDGTNFNQMNGVGNAPAAPIGKFIENWQDSIWILNSTQDISALHFSATSDTNGLAVAPDTITTSTPWPLTNVLYIGRGDGTSGTALWKYRGQLQAGKDRSIYTIYGIDVNTYFARITDAKIGPSSQDSIALVGGLTHFMSKQGIYAYDGIQTKRLSELITPDIAAAAQNQTKTVQASWQTLSDFNRGTYYNSTWTALGLGVLSTFTVTNLANNGDGTQFYTFNNSITSTPFVAITSVNVPGNINYSGNIYSGNIAVKGACGGEAYFNLVFRDLPTSTSYYSQNMSLFNFPTDPQQVSQFQWRVQGVSATAADIRAGNLQVQILLATVNINCATTISSITLDGNGTIQITTNTGSFVSDITTANSVTAWDKFNSVNSNNGGSETFYFKSATSTVNITTQSWGVIPPGAIINASTANLYYQWSSTISALNNTNPLIGNVIINHIEGGVNDTRPMAIDWDNRLWVVLTTSTQNTNLIYVKSKDTNTDNPEAWMPFEGINIKSIARDGYDTLYGGSSTNGTVYRLDYGTNYNGAAITAVYTTKDIALTTDIFKKYILGYMFDYNQLSAANLSLGTSIDGGAYSFRIISTVKSGIVSNRNIIPIDGVNKYCRTIRLQIVNNDLDTPVEINGVHVLYTVTQVR